jgi:hypothetical protein
MIAIWIMIKVIIPHRYIRFAHEILINKEIVPIISNRNHIENNISLIQRGISKCCIYYSLEVITIFSVEEEWVSSE